MKVSAQGKLGGPRSKAYQDFLRRGVGEARSRAALMRLFGGYSELQNAPADEVALMTLVLAGENMAEKEEADKLEANARAQEAQTRGVSNTGGARRFSEDDGFSD